MEWKGHGQKLKIFLICLILQMTQFYNFKTMQIFYIIRKENFKKQPLEVRSKMKQMNLIVYQVDSITTQRVIIPSPVQHSN